MEPNLQTPLYSSRMVITSENETSISFKFEVLFTTIVSGIIPANLNHFHDLVNSLNPDSGYFVCQGVPRDVSALLMNCTTKSACTWGLPFGRVDHKECPLWLMAIPVAGSSMGIHRCDSCTQLTDYVVREAKKRKRITPEQKAARVQPSSHYPMKFLSPVSLKLRRENISRERKLLKRKVSSNE